MKKIKSIKQLKAEKKRLKLHIGELEHKVRGNWTELKECLRPQNIAKDAIGSIFKSKAAVNIQEDSILKSSFTYGISLLAAKFMEKAGNTLSKVFKK